MAIDPISLDGVTKITPVLPVEPIKDSQVLTANDQNEAQDKQTEIHYFSKKDQASIQASVETLNHKLLGKDMKLAYEVHERTGRTMVRLIDMRTEEVIKEIPPANMLDVIGKIWDDMGIAVDRKG
ncbi:flagellar protein FlaG [Enterococcus sp.]|uniref:flagellar protein FlaG n=1 Tax=Enterococcus sp. TaxID=35783 RepID=UPI0028982AF3|nr:flagellar protein FlaG [Enterococcus sp.]